jgi:mono/diheme cytochrome c family protein
LRLFAAAALVALTALAAGCGTEGLPTEGNATRGKEVFTSAEGRCGACHELADAGTKGQVGPNLDEAFAGSREQGFKESTIAAVVLDQIYYPTEGSGMPAKLVEGEDAEAVASYVAEVAGDPEAMKAAAKPPPTKGGKPDGKAIFASAGCATCHTLAAAGATGTVGPNLDEAKPSVELAIERVTNGMGVMPSFKGQLTAAEIRAVAQFVSNSSR